MRCHRSIGCREVPIAKRRGIVVPSVGHTVRIRQTIRGVVGVVRHLRIRDRSRLDCAVADCIISIHEGIGVRARVIGVRQPVQRIVGVVDRRHLVGTGSKLVEVFCGERPASATIQQTVIRLQGSLNEMLSFGLFRLRKGSDFSIQDIVYAYLLLFVSRSRFKV